MKIGYVFLLVVLLTSELAFPQQNPRHIRVDWQTDTAQHHVLLSEFTVVLPKGAFPQLNYPRFVGKADGLRMFFEHEPALVISIKGQAKAYPLNMLTVHEISNDTLANTPLLVTYCPLCNAGLVFDRRLKYRGKEQTLEFAVSGMLRNSDMVMYDRQTESWWQQLLGQALVGKFAGAELEIIPSLIISVNEFFERYPDGKILSRNTGNPRAQFQYGQNPYHRYDAPEGLPYEHFFPHEQLTEQLPPMERVVDIRVGKKYKVYPLSIIAHHGVINDQFEGKSVVLFYQPGTVSVLDEADIRQSREVGSVTAFNAWLAGQRLVFRKIHGRFEDEQTHS